MLERAIAVAVKFHAGQYRKYAIRGQRLPYIVHPIEVMKTVWEWGACEPPVLAAAVLHDVLEDTAVTPKQLAKEFGEEVTHYVRELTHNRQAGDKTEYLQRFASSTVVALIIKLADRCCNIRNRLLVDAEGAKLHLAKSAPLLEAWQARRDEIVQRYGASTAEAIADALDDLAQLVNQSPRRAAPHPP